MADDLCVEIPAIVKARTDETGRRIVEVEASNEHVDLEGDVILQGALLNAAKAFVRSGHLDIDHISEIGARCGIANPTSYIVGRPIEVKDLGDGRTSVVGEIMKSPDGTVDPVANRFDEFWLSLQSQPPVAWRASIYGWPLEGQIVDARVENCPEAPNARRYVVKGIDWRSLAFTLSPVNDSIRGTARVLTAKAFAATMLQRRADIQKSGPSEIVPLLNTVSQDWLLPPRNREELLGHYTWHMMNGQCQHAGPDRPLGRSVAAFREHFLNCCCCEPGDADMRALALMQLLKHYAKTNPDL